ncbi:MAG: hypothetical protein IIA09_01140 [Proteobacteria bacterium]|nr:hypothetical protein [Pseudomonadota bacterium]
MLWSKHRRFALLRNLFLGGALLAPFPVAFAALTVTETTSPTLGVLLTGASGRNFILNTDETVSGTAAADYLSGAVTGRLSVKKTGGSQSATIVADNFSWTGGVSFSVVPCKFDTGSQTTCEGSGITVTLNATKTLYVGVDLNTTAAHTGGQTASATYDITVTLI